jgi:hypothetical protein
MATLLERRFASSVAPFVLLLIVVLLNRFSLARSFRATGTVLNHPSLAAFDVSPEGRSVSLTDCVHKLVARLSPRSVIDGASPNSLDGNPAAAADPNERPLFRAARLVHHEPPAPSVANALST